MAEYYLMSQLPSLDNLGENVNVPITEERFLELCGRYLGKKAQLEVSRLTLAPSEEYEKSGSALIEAWNNGERNLRFALAAVRAERMKKAYDMKNKFLPSEYMKVAQTAAEIVSPMEAERFLNSYRISFLETLRPMDAFSEDAVYYYGLKLKLVLRMRQFDAVVGEAAYRNIYDSILNGDRSEAKT